MIENNELGQKLEELGKEKLGSVKDEHRKEAEQTGNIVFIGAVVDTANAGDLRDLAFQLKGEIDNLVLVLGANINGKANLSIMISDKLVNEKKLNAVKLIRECAEDIKGGGGGQPFFASAGGKNPAGLKAAIDKIRGIVKRTV